MQISADRMTFRFYITPGTIDTLYLYTSVIDESVISELTFTVSTHDNVLKKDKARRVIFGFFLGIMIIMIFYNLTIYLQVNEISYLYYILYIIAFMAFFINKEGYIYEIMYQFTSEPVNTFLLEIFLLCFLLLGRAYLDTKKKPARMGQNTETSYWFYCGRTDSSPCDDHTQ